MKKLLLVLLFGFQFMQAQTTESNSILLQKRNEFRVDLLSLLVFSKLNVTYERFLSKRISVGASFNYTNSKKVNDDFDNGNTNTIPKYEFIPFMRYNLSNGTRSYYFAEVFADANGGDFRETVLLTDENNNGYYTIQKTHYSDLALGGGLGYKYYIKDQFGIEFVVGFGANLFNRAKSPDVISRVGLGFGYRF